MLFGSVCSGIEAASVAWAPLGWRAQFVSEIDRFPCAVLAERHGSNLPGEPLARNGVPNLGDMTQFEDWPDHAIDLLVGGTPCQSFSVAGLRKGLDDPRGNLMLVYGAIARRYRPRWLVWENVPGVLSDDGGRSFAGLLGLLSGRRVETPPGGWRSAGVVTGIDDAYGLAWRVLDAQFVRVDGLGRAVPQRRRRVFVVGYLGDWRRAAAVLFERASLSGDPPPRREAGKGAAPTLSARTRGGGGLGTDVANTLSADRGKASAHDATLETYLPVARCDTAGHGQRIDFETETFVAHALRADGFDASEDGTGRGTPLVPVGVALRGRDDGATAELTGDVMTALRCGGGGGDKPHVVAPMAFDETQITSVGESSAWRVRRLMPVECERLQGFPDCYTDIAYRGKPAADGPRYKAIGNSMAVNVMRWIGTRIQLVEDLMS